MKIRNKNLSKGQEGKRREIRKKKMHESNTDKVINEASFDQDHLWKGVNFVENSTENEPANHSAFIRYRTARFV